jgi:hypothetical protein
MTTADYSAFIPVILTGLVAFLGTWAGSRFSHSNEHKQWLRNEKMAACSDFLTQVEGLLQVVGKASDVRVLRKTRDEASEVSLMKLSIVFPFEVVQSAQRLKRALMDVSEQAAETAFIPVDEREAWQVKVGKALQAAERQQLEFVFESSRDLNSGRFYGSGVVAPLQMWVLRRRLKAMEAVS